MANPQSDLGRQRQDRSVYGHRLEEINGKVIQLFALVGEGVAAGTVALLDGDRQVARDLMERDALIDSLYHDVEQLVNLELALQAPLSNDLPFLLTVLRIVPELERSHDLAEHIGRRGSHNLGDELSPRARGLIGQMGALGVEMWRVAADAWSEHDKAAYQWLRGRDDEMDDLYASLIAELASGRMTLPIAMDMTLVARFFERLGDHAVNLGSRVRHLAESSP